MPTQRPLMNRPTTNIATFWAAQVMVLPMSQMKAPIMIAYFLPTLSAIQPETMAPMNEPPWHRRSDASLGRGIRSIGCVKVGIVLSSAKNSRDRRNIETEEATADDSHRSDKVGVGNLIHGRGCGQGARGRGASFYTLRSLFQPPPITLCLLFPMRASG